MKYQRGDLLWWAPVDSGGTQRNIYGLVTGVDSPEEYHLVLVGGKWNGDSPFEWKATRDQVDNANNVFLISTSEAAEE